MKAMLEEKGAACGNGPFPRAHMDVELVNDGPVTILIDSRRCFEMLKIECVVCGALEEKRLYR